MNEFDELFDLEPLVPTSEFGILPDPAPVYNLEDCMSLLHVINNKLQNLETKVHELAGRTEFKKERKTRTTVNRCQHRNRKNEPCKSYICKKSKVLCHAHHALCHSIGSNYLYGRR